MPASGQASPRATVLLVEDNPDNRGIYRAILEHGNIEVLEAEDGAAGVRLAQERHPDLILMDVSVPIMDGWEATKLLKQDPATCDIQIIALTAHALQSDRQRAAAVGCDGYIAKPALPRAVYEEVVRRLGLDV
jgi:two-component system, cell cycle response regulator DivK